MSNSSSVKRKREQIGEQLASRSGQDPISFLPSLAQPAPPLPNISSLPSPQTPLMILLSWTYQRSTTTEGFFWTRSSTGCSDSSDSTGPTACSGASKVRSSRRRQPTISLLDVASESGFLYSRRPQPASAAGHSSDTRALSCRKACLTHSPRSTR